MQGKQYRQGDVWLFESPEAEPGEEVVDPRGAVLAEGSTSHHFHTVSGMGAHAKLFRFRTPTTDRLLRVADGGAVMRVIGAGSGSGAAARDRHTEIAIPTKTYTRRVQRAYGLAAQRAHNVTD
jgi:hypothetical protein